MNEQCVRPAETLLKAANDDVLRGEARSRDVEGTAPEPGEGMTHGGVRTVYGGVFAIASNGAKVLGEKLLDNTERNAEAIFAAAKAVVRCKDVSELAKVQSDFVQSQLALSGEQARQFYELSAQIGKETVEAGQAATSKAMAEMQGRS